MKTIILGDLHGINAWKLAISNEKLTKDDRVIFLGDYFDSFDKSLTSTIQINNFLDIVEYKKSCEASNGPEVVILIGNHDYHYFKLTFSERCSGYQYLMASFISQAIEDNKHHLQIAYQFGDYLCTHAGVSQVFMNSVFGNDGWNLDTICQDINELFKHKPKCIAFSPYDISGYGEDETQSPIWIRPKSLMQANLKSDLENSVIQIVGHTGQISINLDSKDINARYHFIDTMNSSGEYLIIEDNNLKIGNTR